MKSTSIERLRGVAISVLVAALAAGCSDDTTGVADAGADAAIDGAAGDLTALDGASADAPATCNHEAWSAGTQAFKESTAWNLDAVQCTRLTVADIDGDGWADLVPRHAGAGWVLRNTGQGSFEDVTASSGLYAARDGTDPRKVDPVTFADVDNDGDLDAYTGVASATGGQSELMINDGTGVFSFGPEGSPLRNVGQAEHPAGGAFVDVDRDGNVDVWVPHNGDGTVIARQDRLYAGDGTGGFTDVTADWGLTTLQWAKIDDLNGAQCHSRAWGALACDLNDDGLPELLTPSYGRAPNHLWQAQQSGGKVAYTNRSVASGYAYDAEQDWTDNQFALCYCQANPSAEGCSGLPAPRVSCTTTNWVHQQDREPFRLGGNSASTSCADLNNDGYMDLVSGEIKHWWAGENADGSQVLLNTGKPDVTFTRLADEDIGLHITKQTASWDEGHMTQLVFDFDNDGLLDIYQGDSDYPGTRGHLYHQVPSDTQEPKFEEVPLADGIDHNRSHGVVAADFDRDGDLDLVVGHSHMRCGSSGECYPDTRPRLFENVVGNKNAWVQLHLVGDGKTANRAAIGAQVRVEACGMTQTQQVNGGYGHFGAQNDMVLHFGAGDAKTVKVTIQWPDASRTEQSFTVATGKRYEVAQGSDPVEAP